MKSMTSFNNLLRAAVLGLLASALLPLGSCIATAASPPNFMSYQGYLTGATNQPLGLNAPTNYVVIFRIYSDASSKDPTKRLWTEQQVVTVDKGYFSVVLGEGTAYPADATAETQPPLSAVFSGDDITERYIEMTVIVNGESHTIMPRLRLLPAPYAFAASVASAANSLATNASGDASHLTGLNADQLASGTIPDARFPSTLLRINGNGSGLTGLNASSLASGTIPDARFPANVVRADSSQGRVTLKGSSPGVILAEPNGTLHGFMGLAYPQNLNQFCIWSYSLPSPPLLVDLNNGSIWTAGTLHANDKVTIASGGLEVHGNLSVLDGDILLGGPNKRIWYLSNGHLYALVPNNNSFPDVKGSTGASFWEEGKFSDKRLKTNISTIPNALEKLALLRGVTFNWNETALLKLTKDIPDNVKSASGDPAEDQKAKAMAVQGAREKLGNQQTGFIAQEVEQVFPDWVSTDADGYKKIDMSKLDSVIVNAIKEQQEQIETLKRDNQDLRDEMADLKALLSNLVRQAGK